MIDVHALMEALDLTRAGSIDDAVAMSAATSYAIFELAAEAGDDVPTHEQLQRFAGRIAEGSNFLFNL